MNSLLQTARFLEVPAKNRPLESGMQYLNLLDKGLPVKSIHRVADALAPEDREFRYRIVPRATFARLKGRRLSKSQSELVTRLAEMWTSAVRVWKTEDEARLFLNRHHPLLDNERPMDVALQSAVGAQLVQDILGRLENGTAV